MTTAAPVPALADHPELQQEQAYVSRAYHLLDKGLASVEHTY